MASDNGAYTQFDDTIASNYGSTNSPNVGQAYQNENDGKNIKKWKNSRRICWALLAISVVTVILEIAGASVSGVHLDWLLARFVAGVWLAALGVVSAGIGLRAFRNSYENSQCWTHTHFIMCIIATVAYGILLLMSAVEVYSSRRTLEEFYEILASEDYEMEPEPEPEVPLNSTDLVLTTTMEANISTTAIPSYDAYEAKAILNAIKGDLAISVFLLGTTLAFVVTGIIASIIICRHWCGRGQKTMTIVYMPQDQTSNTQNQSVVLPPKTQVTIQPQAIVTVHHANGIFR